MSLEAPTAAISPAAGTAAPSSEPTPAEAPAALMPASNNDAALDDELMRVWDKNNPDRDEGGRYQRTGPGANGTETPGEPGKDSADQTAGKTPETGAARAASSIEAPNAWSAEEKALWAKVPPEAQAIVARREAEAHQAITRAGEHAKAYEPIRNVIDGNRDVFKALRIEPAEGLAKIFEIERALMNPQTRDSALEVIARAYGADLAKLANGRAAPGHQQGQPNPELEALKRQVNGLTQHLTAAQQADQDRHDAQLAQTIIDFSKSKDKDHWSAVETTLMPPILTAILEQEPNLSLEAAMEKAFDQAIHAHPQLREKLRANAQKAEAEKRAKEDADRASRARRAGAVNVGGDPGGGPAPKSMDETLEEIAFKAYGRRR